ncbi:MAG: hypothetical protein IJS31_06435 [Oscillospiraceae bacterium]|nr:hypothetical protein [Oscillospiraceae bacterium]
MKKRILSIALCICMAISLFAGLTVTAEAANWSSDWKYWSQGASDDSLMRNYGCWVVAQARLLKKAGIETSSSFTPDVYKDWEYSNGYLDSGFYQTNGTYAPIAYAKQKGNNGLSYVGTLSATTSNIIANANAGHLMILKVNIGNGKHYIFVDNESTISSNKVYIYESWTDYSEVGSKPADWTNSYTWVEIYVYSYTSHTHSYSSSVTTQPGCTTTGVRTYTCSCGASYTETIAATGHKWDSGEIVQNAGCTDEGVKKFTCTNCGTTRTEAISPIGHDPVTDSAVSATCTEDGLTEGSHCANCNAILTAQQIVPALGHNNKVQAVNRDCDHVSVDYVCTRCGQTSNETRDDYVLSEWSEDYPENVDESAIESKTQYSYRDKNTEYQDGNSSLTGWMYTGQSESIYGSWSNAGWTKDRPTESDTLRITDTKTVTDQAAHGYILYYYYYPGTSAKFRYKDYGGSSGRFQLEVASISDVTPSTEGPWYDDGTTYKGYWNGTGVVWFLDINNSAQYPQNAVTHTEWYYQTRTETTRYYFEKWSNYSDWSDIACEVAEGREIQTRTVYRYRITPIGHNLTHVPAVAPKTVSAGNVEYWRCSACNGYFLDADATTETTAENVILPKLDDPTPINPDATLTITGGKARAGQTVTVALQLSENPGIAGMRLNVSYDSALTLEKAETGDTLTTLAFTKPGNLSANPVALFWDGMDDDTTCGETGTILVLTFRVAEGTEAGEYPVTVTYVSDEVYNAAFEDVTLAVQNGTVTVIDYVTGDANGDMLVNGKDVTVLRQYLAGGYNVTIDEHAADANHDGKANGKDVTMLRQYLAGGYGIVLD